MSQHSSSRACIAQQEAYTERESSYENPSLVEMLAVSLNEVGNYYCKKAANDTISVLMEDSFGLDEIRRNDNSLERCDEITNNIVSMHGHFPIFL